MVQYHSFSPSTSIKDSADPIHQDNDSPALVFGASTATSKMCFHNTEGASHRKGQPSSTCIREGFDKRSVVVHGRTEVQITSQVFSSSSCKFNLKFHAGRLFVYLSNWHYVGLLSKFTLLCCHVLL